MAVKVSVTVCLIPEAKGGPFVLWDDLPAAVRTAAELGFDAVELFPPEPDALDPKAVRDTPRAAQARRLGRRQRRRLGAAQAVADACRRGPPRRGPATFVRVDDRLRRGP